MRLVERDDYVGAYSIASEAERYIPSDPVLAGLWPDISRTGSIHTDPSGADIYVKEYAAVDEDWEYLGRSPIDDIRLPRAVFRWRIEREGFQTAEIARRSPNNIMNFVLGAVGEVPSRMVPVPGESFWVPLNGFAPYDVFEVDSYWVDQYEVTYSRSTLTGLISTR
jgi:hypothetical protein